LVSGISNSLSWIPFILPAIAGILALVYKKKAENAEAEVIVSRTQAADAPLAAKQAQDQEQINQVDENLKKLEDERKKAEEQRKKETDQEKADSWNKK
jgi:uncharacterized coiled-coil DUF342 family protein